MHEILRITVVVHDEGNEVLADKVLHSSIGTPHFRVGLQSHATNYKAVFYYTI